VDPQLDIRPVEKHGGEKGQRLRSGMSYTVEFIKFQDGAAEPVVLWTVPQPLETERKALYAAQHMLPQARDAFGAIGYRVRDEASVITTRVAGIDA
jgi:hypothetical protein